MAAHSSALAWRIPGTGEPGGLLSLGLHRGRHDWSDLAAAAAEGDRARCHLCSSSVCIRRNFCETIQYLWDVDIGCKQQALSSLHSISMLLLNACYVSGSILDTRIHEVWQTHTHTHTHTHKLCSQGIHYKVEGVEWQTNKQIKCLKIHRVKAMAFP